MGLLRIWVRPFLLISLAGVSLYLLGIAGDFFHLTRVITTLSMVMPTHQGDARQLITSLLELIAGLLGLLFTVSAILVELSATRYSSRVVDLFVSDRVNLSYFTLTVVTPLYGFWLALTLDILPWPTFHFTLFSFLVSLDLVLLVPYINYLFGCLTPDAIVRRIVGSVDLARVEKSGGRGLPRARQNLVTSVSQLSDVVLSSMNTADINLSARAIEAIRDLGVSYLRHKSRLPPLWFDFSPEIFPGMPAAKRQELRESHTWVEMFCFKQLELVFVQSAGRFRELCTAVASCTRALGEVAGGVGDTCSRELCLLFFNTLLRHAMNVADVRTLSHCLYQYRLLGEAHLHARDGASLDKIAFYFKYYGQECEKRGLGFVMEIVAYDLRRLVQEAWHHHREGVPALLEVILEVDHIPDTAEGELSQRGVRKSQILLAAFFLREGAADFAEKIALDLRDEPAERIESMEKELSTRTSAEFWEIQDRDANFYYVPDEMRPALEQFFRRFRGGV